MIPDDEDVSEEPPMDRDEEMDEALEDEMNPEDAVVTLKEFQNLK